jgi:serine-type D-Ala-D-Ala carboxypeptidase (penicillin-binding protein 5/6)
MCRANRSLIRLHSNPSRESRQVLLGASLLRAALLVCLLFGSLATAGFGPPVISDGGYPPVRLYPDQIAALESQNRPPVITAASALLLDVDSGQVLFALNPDQPLPPASTAKIITALVVLERANLDDIVTVSPAAAATEGSRMGLQAGERLTVRDLLYGLLLPSGNDAAVALAEHVAGSTADFVALMNQTSAGLGLGQSHFVNPHGLDADDQTSSAADLAKAAMAALKYPVFAGIVATPTAQIAGHALTNTNELLGSLPGADGIKTGTTDAAGECLVASVSRRGHRLLAVLLNSRDRYGDARGLYKFAADHWEWRPVTLPDDALAWETGPDGRAYRLRADATTDLFLPTWQWQYVQPIRVIDPTVPLTGTAPIGELKITLPGGQTLATLPLHVWQSP